MSTIIAGQDKLNSLLSRSYSPRTKLALVTFRASPMKVFPEDRIRAILAEAALQGVDFEIIDALSSSPKLLQSYQWRRGTWQLLPARFPDVTMVIGEALNETQKVLLEEISSVSTVIQDRNLTKLEQLALFRSSPAKEFLIPTEQLSSEDLKHQIRDFTLRHRGAVIKRSDGNKGNGIFFLSPDNETWRLTIDQSVRLGSLSECVEFVARKIAGRIIYRNFLIQKLVNSSTTDGRATDIRVHIQRGCTGDWNITRSYVRVGAFGQLTANYSKAGTQGALEPALASRQVLPPEVIKTKLFQASKLITNIQDKASSPPLSELGLDFLLDTQDRIWLVETNALPQSALHEHPRAQHLVGYARWLVQ